MYSRTTLFVAITNCQITCCRLSSSHKIGSAGIAANGVVLWDLAEKRRLREPLTLSEGDLTALAFSPNTVQRRMTIASRNSFWG